MIEVTLSIEGTSICVHVALIDRSFDYCVHVALIDISFDYWMLTLYVIFLHSKVYLDF
jgi:hypothetical protein